MLLSRFKTLLSQLLLISGLLVLQLNSPTPVQAQTSEWTGVCVGNTVADLYVPTSGLAGLNAGKARVATANTDVATIQGIQCLLANVLATSLTSLGMTVAVMLGIGALQQQFSGGNAQGVEKSHQTMTRAVQSIVVFLSSFIILNLIANFTGVFSILKFVIPDSTTIWG